MTRRRQSGRQWLRQTVREMRAANAHIPPDKIQKIVDETVAEVRTERPARRRGSVARKGREASSPAVASQPEN
jgi:hypothetical protein